MTACSTSRTATSSNKELRTTELRSTETRDSVTIELRDTVLETKTITYVVKENENQNEKYDTVKVVQVTDRYRRRDASQLTDKSEKRIVETDTVYVAVRDSVLVERHQPSAVSHQTSSLKWIFWILVALIGLIITVKVCLRKVF